MPHGFKRILLSLRPSAPERGTRLAVRLAEQLGLELLGSFIEDVNIGRLAALSALREISATGGGWRPVDAADISQEIENAARRARRLFLEIGGGLAKVRFEIARGSAADAIASRSQMGDIIVIAAPADPGERIAEPYASMLSAAFRSEAAVMLEPPRLARTSGPIVAIAAAPEDPIAEIAAAIAAASAQELIIFRAHRGLTETPTHAPQVVAGMPVRRTAGRDDGSQEAPLFEALHGLRESMFVLSRGSFGDEISIGIASARRVPVLTISPQQAAARKPP